MGWALAHRFSVCFCFVGGSRKPTHVPVLFRPPSWRPSHFLLLVQEKVTKENTPSRPRSPVKPATAQARYGGSLTGHPWPDSERVCILHTPLRAFSSTHLPRPRGTRKSKAKNEESQKLRHSAQAGIQLLPSGPSVTRRRA